MHRILWNGQSAMNANQIKLDIISNNIANMSTNGYKRVEVNFKDSLKESLEGRGYPSTNKGSFTGTGVIAGETSREHYQGALLETGISTDLGIDGLGMFKVTDAYGKEFYTRDGSFIIDINGDIVDSNGNKLDIEYTQEYLNLKNQGFDTLDSKNFIVDSEGKIFRKYDGRLINVGKVPLYSANGSDPYISVGKNLFIPKENVQINKINDTSIYQGKLEASNVDIGQEFSDMIITQRAFQLGSKSITTADEMWSMVNNMRSK